MTVVRIRLSLSFIIVCRVFEHVLTLFVEHYIQPAKNPTLPNSGEIFTQWTSSVVVVTNSV